MSTSSRTLAGPRNWLFLPLLPEREPDPGLEPELGLEPVLPFELCSHSSCTADKGGMKQKASMCTENQETERSSQCNILLVQSGNWIFALEKKPLTEFGN